MNRPMRLLTPLLAFATLASACAGQSAPEREPLIIPTSIVPDSIVPTDLAEVFTEGECTIGVATGARVLSITHGSTSEGILQAGDIILSVDDTLVTSRESLLSVLAGRMVGDQVTVGGTRAGSEFSVEVALGSAPDEADRAILGLVAETRLEGSTLSGLADAQLDGPNAQVAVVEDQIYRFDPVSGQWSAQPGVPVASMVGLGDDLYSVSPNESLSLVRVADGELITVDVAPLTIQPEPELRQAVASEFGTVLAAVGDIVLVSALASIGETGVSTVVYGVDPETAVARWGYLLNLAESGNLQTPLVGYRSPAGDRALVGLAELSTATGAVTEIRNYVVLDQEGAATIPPSINGVAPNGVVTGWYDEESVVYAVAQTQPVVMQWSFATGEHNPVVSFSEADAAGLVTVIPVGDSNHLVAVYDDQVALLDSSVRAVVRPVSSGCNHIPVAG